MHKTNSKSIIDSIRPSPLRSGSKSTTSSPREEEDSSRTLIRATTSGDLSTVQQLSKSVDVNSTDGHGKTALMVAAEVGHLQIVKHLVSKKAKLNDKDCQGWTALHYAAVEGHLDIVMYLVKKGHDPNARNADRTSCLHYLVRQDWTEKLKKTINVLIKHGAQIDAKNKFDLTPLQAAASRGKVGVVQFLLSKKANVNARNKFGDSALQMSVVSGNKEMVKLLLDNGANPTFRSEGQYGDMIKTAQHCGHHEIKILLEEYTAMWLRSNALVDPADDQWKTYSTLQRLKYSSLVDISKINFALEDEISVLVDLIQRPIVKEINGWIVEEGVLQVPKVPVLHDFDVPIMEYKNFFCGRSHYNFFGNFQSLGKDAEPLVVSVAVYEEIEGDYRTILWSVKGTSYMTIPTEILNPADLQGSAKKLSGYLRAFFEEKFAHENMKQISVKLEPVPFTMKNKVEEELEIFEKNDPQVPRQMAVGVIYCKEGQKGEEQYFGNDHADASPEYLEFLKIIGEEVVLEKYDGYTGDLDVSGKNFNGEKSVTYRDEKFCIMYHVSTMLPRSDAEEEDQQITRKRFVGNDITTVVFQDGGAFPQLIRSHFLHNYIVVSPVDLKGIMHYKVSVLRQEEVPEYKPTLCQPVVMTAECLSIFLTSKVGCPSFSQARTPPHLEGKTVDAWLDCATL